MKMSTLNKFFGGLCWLLACSSVGYAGPDQFVGDTAIYSVGKAVRHNILFIIDNSSTMGNAAIGLPYTLYDPSTGLPWAGDENNHYDPWTVYKMEGQSNFVAHITNENETLSSISCGTAQTALLENGTYSGGPGMELDNKGACGKSSAGTVYLGNLLNYHNTTPTGGETMSQIQLVQENLEKVAAVYRDRANIGIMEFGHNNKGGQLTYAVQDLTTDAAYNGFLSALDNVVTYVQLTPGNSRPLAESLLDAQFYFQKDRGSSSTPVSHVTVPDSPVDAWCARNFVIFITNGDTVGDSDPGMCTIISASKNCACETYDGDYDCDGCTPEAEVPDDADLIPGSGDVCQSNVYGNGTHLMDDVAKYAFDSDLSSGLDGLQSLQTSALLIFSPEKKLLESAALRGGGDYAEANSANELDEKLGAIIENIVKPVDTAFVAPVVPASPENRTASGSRIYLGFFKPQSQKPWWGNLKKFGIDSENNIVDKNGEQVIDPDYGTFEEDTTSFWNDTDTPDGGAVSLGGVGGILLARAIVPGTVGEALHTAANSRKIYTYLGNSINLTDSSNAFDIDNESLSYDVHFGLEKDEEKNDLIRFVHGLDYYDDDLDSDIGGNNIKNEKRSWILGDVMHSKPLVLTYNTYPFNATNEEDAAVNKTYIFVGANDGMLHAFRDRDGVEEWAFIPPSLLPDLKYLDGNTHTYFVDGSPVAYVHDANKDGDIVANDGDAAILIIGTRRGGGKDTLAADLPLGSYCALDITDPTSPKFLWQINNLTTGFSELGEPWGLPKLAKVKIDGIRKIVAIFGAGYDNNEDWRFGNTQTYPDDVDSDTELGTTATDFSEGKSSGAAAKYNPRGRGIYVVEVARLNENNGVFTPDFTYTGGIVWSYTTNMSYSIPSDITVLDRDRDGFADRLYAGDTGGQIWSCDVGSTAVGGLSCTLLFKSNPGNEDSPTTGRKIFYKPTVTYLDSNTTMLYFGTGDRAHPLNYLKPGDADGTTIDRFYAIQDRDIDDNPNGAPTVLTEDYLVDVTENELQQAYESTEAENTATEAILNQLYNDQTKYGWMIRFDHYDGEKVLASPSVFNKVTFFTTYTPYSLEEIADGDPCNSNNLGAARLYAVNYRTGEAVFNYYTASGTDTYSENQDSANNSRAADSNDEGNSWVLRRADRELAIGNGISPSMVFIINKDGKATGDIFLGDKVERIDPEDDGMIYPVYWLQK